MTKITYTLSAHDDGYRIRDWFEGGQPTLDAAAEAATAAEAETILSEAYRGPDVDGVEVTWRVGTTIVAAGYIIPDAQGNAIFGVGASVDEAWAQVVADAGPWEDLDDNARDLDEVFSTDFCVYPATAALLAEVEDKGGAITWDVIGGVACTTDEAEAQ